MMSDLIGVLPHESPITHIARWDTSLTNSFTVKLTVGLKLKVTHLSLTEKNVNFHMIFYIAILIKAIHYNGATVALSIYPFQSHICIRKYRFHQLPFSSLVKWEKAVSVSHTNVIRTVVRTGDGCIQLISSMEMILEEFDSSVTICPKHGLQ